MDYLMTRSFAEHMGVTWPPDVACIVDGRQVTWSEVLANRRKMQAKRLDDIRRQYPQTVVPAYVWTFFNANPFPYHGWYCYVVTRYESIAVNFRGFQSGLAESIMRAIPLGILPLEDNFDLWMEAFARKYPRRKTARDRRKAGSRIGWYDRVRKVFVATKI